MNMNTEVHVHIVIQGFMWSTPSWLIKTPLPNKFSGLLKKVNDYRALCLRFTMASLSCAHLVTVSLKSQDPETARKLQV
jgi:hypothetical protein